jgi:hypothetical protein
MAATKTRRPAGARLRRLLTALLGCGRGGELFGSLSSGLGTCNCSASWANSSSVMSTWAAKVGAQRSPTCSAEWPGHPARDGVAWWGP